MISVTTPEDIARCFETIQELRPHLTDKTAFVSQVIQQQKDGYQLVAITDQSNHQVVGCIGFRIMTTLCWGKIIYVDDLITKSSCRGKGYGSDLLDHAINFAKEHGCSQVHLDTGYTRHAAHRVYLKKGFQLHAHHMQLRLNELSIA